MMLIVNAWLTLTEIIKYLDFRFMIGTFPNWLISKLNHPQIIPSSNQHIFKSSHLQIIPSSNQKIIHHSSFFIFHFQIYRSKCTVPLSSPFSPLRVVYRAMNIYVPCGCLPPSHAWFLPSNSFCPILGAKTSISQSAMP